MRKFLVAASLFTLAFVPAAAQAGFVFDASLGQGYQVSPTPRQREQLNLELSPGFSLPVVSMIRLQLGIVTDFATKSDTKTNLELRPMVTIAPPLIPLYGRLIFGVSNLFERGSQKREIVYGGALGLSVGLPSIAFLPGFGVFVEAGVLPRKRDFGSIGATGALQTESKFAWVLEGRAGAYMVF
jgi:hypothetical protein